MCKNAPNKGTAVGNPTKSDVELFLEEPMHALTYSDSKI